MVSRSHITLATTAMAVVLISTFSTGVSGAPTPKDFPYGGRSFNIAQIWQYCMRNHIDIEPEFGPNFDYGKNISAMLAELSKSGGGSVRLLSGTYYVHTPIRMANNTCLIGQSMTDVTIKVSNRSELSGLKENRGVLHAITPYNNTIRDLTIDAGSYPGKGVGCDAHQLSKFGTYLEGAQNLYLTNLRVRNACAYGIDFPGNDYTMSKNVAVSRVRVDSCGKDGIKVVRSYNVSLDHSVSIKNGRHGLHVAGSKMVLVLASIFANEGRTKKLRGCGILLTDREGLWTNGVTVSHPRVFNAYRAGICISKASDVLVNDATITNTRVKNAPCYEITSAKNYKIVRGTCSAKIGKEFSAMCMGIRKSGVCCPKICKKCGGVGCSKRAPYGACCVKKIKAVGNSCADGPPPCNL